MRIIGFDHVVLIVSDVERSLRFYADQLGMETVRLDEWRRGEVSFPSVRVNDHTILDLFQGEPDGRNQDHFCLVMEPADLDAMAASGEFDVVRGPNKAFGAQGTGHSLYVRDPDGNVVELRYYQD